jgi:hypothetical protein
MGAYFSLVKRTPTLNLSYRHIFQLDQCLSATPITEITYLLQISLHMKESNTKSHNKVELQKSEVPLQLFLVATVQIPLRQHQKSIFSNSDASKKETMHNVVDLRFSSKERGRIGWINDPPLTCQWGLGHTGACEPNTSKLHEVTSSHKFCNLLV